VDDEELFRSLADGLRTAQERVAALEVPEAEKSRVRRHLVAISDASKHDLRRADQRLQAFLRDLEERFPPG
jgi:hypothetical protein